MAKRDPDTGKFIAEDEEKAVFTSKYREQVLVMSPGEFGGNKSRRIEFSNGFYKTDDEEEIEYLKKIAENPRPGCRIQVAQDIQD